MTTMQTFFAGLDPDHIPGLLAGVLLALLAPLTRLWRRSGTRPAVPVSDRFAGWLLADSAAIHLALPIGHHDDPVLTFLFLASGVAYGVLGWRAIVGGRYRTPSALLIIATLIAYIDVVATGGEGADQVGIVTALLEIVALGICLVPRGPAPVRRTLGSALFVLTVVASGAALWVTSFATHASQSTTTADGVPAHNHGADRAQAGVIMAPVDDPVPTAAQVQAAAVLAAQTKDDLAKYTDIHAAIAAGYTASLSRTGLRVHLENKAYGKDGRILDPQYPEMLMYAIADGKATLLSAVYQMPYAGQPGPIPGGPLTRWHAHDLCMTLLPPGYTVVDVYGSCPLLSISVTVPEMMHVWVVDHPGGPYNDDVPDSWIRAFNLAHGLPFEWPSRS